MDNCYHMMRLDLVFDRKSKYELDNLNWAYLQ